ncbi:MAG: hypothetical protein J6P60_06460 [Lachnospiraceae bacterium]|nr:hypothetical protein [Lachnospiraceae bacterium]
MNGDQYALTAVVLPVTPLISACSAQADATEDPDTKAELEKTLAVMDRVVNVELITEGYAQGRTGISMFWSEGDHFVRPHSPADFAAFRSAYYGLILRYPMVFLEERWTTFLQSEDLLENTTVIFDGTGVQNHERFAGLFLNRPISSSLRKKTIALLEMRSLRDYDEKIPAYHVVYHVMLPLCLLLLLLAGLLLRRRLDYAILLLSHLCKVPLIFLTAPSRLFMYYYPVYLTGVFAVTLLLVGKLSRTVGDDSVREKERERETADE